jgi:hypothetical protein
MNFILCVDGHQEKKNINVKGQTSVNETSKNRK